METITILKGITVLRDKRELNLHGPECTNAINEEGFHENFYKLKNLNHLSISVDLKELPTRFVTLTNISSLVLHSNKLKTIPSEIGSLPKLKLLDLSRNCIDVFPDCLSNMLQLSTLNLSNNNLLTVPSLRNNVKLTTLNLSCNKIEIFPDCCYTELSQLSEIFLNSNQITVISSDIHKLHGLKALDLGDNKIKEIVPELSQVPKLRDLNLSGNKLKDNRLMKMVKQCHNKQVIDFIKQHYGKLTNSRSERKTSERHSGSEDKENNLDEIDEPPQIPKYLIQVFKPEVNGIEIHMITSAVKPIRQSIVCCLLKNIKFTEGNFKKFIQFQNKFHDTVCNRRERATLGTHDVKLFQPPLKYTAMAPDELYIVPLGEHLLTTAAQYIDKKKVESENITKTRKRQVQTGTTKFLHLVERLEQYACLMDSKQTVLSFPPITNSQVSKISHSTTTILVEVTSIHDKKICKDVMDEFIKECIRLNIGTVDENKTSVLEIEQVVIISENGPKLHYPADGDLVFPPSADIKKTQMF